MKINFNLLISIGLAVALIFSVKSCSDNKKEKEQAITQAQLDKQTLDSVKNKAGQTIVMQEAIITKSSTAIGNLTDSIFKLKKTQQKQIKQVEAYYKGITKTQLKDVLVPYKDTVAFKQFSDSLNKACAEVIDYYERNTIPVPRVVEDSTPNYSINATVQIDGLKIDSLTIIDVQHIRFSTLKGGFLKKNQAGKLKLFLPKTIRVEVLHTNPLIQVTGESSAFYVPAKKLRILEKLILIGGGIIIGGL